MILEETPADRPARRRRLDAAELIISHGKSGYLALYEYSAGEGLIRVVAVRHQREAGFRGK
jgi:hypothetical protein